MKHMKNDVQSSAPSGWPSAVPTATDLFKQYVERQGYTKEDQANLGMKLVEPGGVLAKELEKVFGFRITKPCVTIMCPSWPDNYLRLRVLGDLPKGASKYLSPKRSKHGHPYLRPGLDWASIKADTQQCVAITEGEGKGYVGCRGLNMPVIGLPGVAMIEPLFNGEWHWEKRNVIVAFDHDPPSEPGQYKPDVAIALGALCHHLVMAGANVQVAHLGKIDILDPAQKWGLDDAIRAGVTDKHIADVLAGPPEWCEYMTYFDQNCVVVRGDKPHIWNKDDGTRMVPDTFIGFWSKWLRWQRSGDGGKAVVVAKQWYSKSSRPEARGYTYDPQSEFGWDPETQLINLWQDYPDWSGKGEWDWSQGLEACRSPVLELDYLLQRLFGPHKDLFCCWIGHMLTRPWEATTICFGVRSELKGVGKSLVGAIVRSLTGPIAGREVDPDIEVGNFTTTGADKSIFEDWPEVNLLGRTTSGRIRNLITAAEYWIHPKGLAAFPVPNRKRHYFTYNTAAPFKVDANERRLVACAPDITEAEHQFEHQEWIDWFAKWSTTDPDFLGDAWRYFAEYPGLEEFNPRMFAPNSEELQNVAVAGQSTNENAIYNFVHAVNSEVDDWFALIETVHGKPKLSAAIRNALVSHEWERATLKVSVPSKVGSPKKVSAYIFARKSFGLKVAVDSSYNRVCTDARLLPGTAGNPVLECAKGWDTRFSDLFADWEGEK